MKVRMDFVTNSSSSSFLIAFKDKIEGIEKINSLRDYYGEMYMDELCHDFIAADPLTISDLNIDNFPEIEDEVYCDLCDWGWARYNNYYSFKSKWLRDHPGKTELDFTSSEEFEAELKRRINERINGIKKDLQGREYLVSLEYEDHNTIGSELEHEILPECDFVVRRFSHH